MINFVLSQILPQTLEFIKQLDKFDLEGIIDYIKYSGTENHVRSLNCFVSLHCLLGRIFLNLLFDLQRRIPILRYSFLILLRIILNIQEVINGMALHGLLVEFQVYLSICHLCQIQPCKEPFLTLSLTLKPTAVYNYVQSNPLCQFSRYD